MIVARYFAVSWLLVLNSLVSAAEPQWIWSHEKATEKAEAGECAFRKTFQATRVGDAKLEIAADNRFELFINGRHVGSGEGWTQRKQFDITSLLLPGRNLVAVRALNEGESPAGLMVQLHLKPTIGVAEKIVSDASWKVDSKPPRGWQGPEFDDSKWAAAAELGEYGKTAPWGAAGTLVSADAPPPLTKGRDPERGLFEFKDNDRLVLLGSTFIERMQSNGYFELELQCALPDKKISVRNLGWSGDNVWGDARAVFGQRADGFKRLVRDLHQCEPTAILVCYGENEAYAGEAGLLDFRQGFETLLATLEATGARIVVATPRKHENLGKPFPDPTEYNKSLRMYCDEMKAIAKRREHTFVDWYDAFVGETLTENGVHLEPWGYHLMSLAMSDSLGGCSLGWELEVNLKEQIFSAIGTTVTEIQTEKKAIKLSIQDRRLPLTISVRSHGPSGHSRLDIPSKNDTSTPTYYPNGKFSILGLEKGSYEFRLNDEILGEAKAVDAESKTWIAYHPKPENAFERREELRAFILEKDFLFFNRYRPQNETYLFLFRKHEQGNNAVEIPQFDPLINELDKKIAELKKPTKQKFELRRVEK